jgi:hypothetical protein
VTVNRLTDHFAAAEIAQLEADLAPDPQWIDALAEDAEDRRFRRKAWTVLACALAGFWIVLGAVVWMVVL